MSKHNQIGLIRAKNTRIAELEQCIREQWEALRDKGMVAKYVDVPTHTEPQYRRRFDLSLLSIQEQAFMLKAESLLKLKEGKE